MPATPRARRRHDRAGLGSPPAELPEALLGLRLERRARVVSDEGLERGALALGVPERTQRARQAVARVLGERTVGPRTQRRLVQPARARGLLQVVVAQPGRGDLGDVSGGRARVLARDLLVDVVGLLPAPLAAQRVGAGEQILGLLLDN